MILARGKHGETAADSNPGAVWVIDGANVVGSRPDGWWRDRAGAARRLYERLAATFPGVGVGDDEAAGFGLADDGLTEFPTTTERTPAGGADDPAVGSAAAPGVSGSASGERAPADDSGSHSEGRAGRRGGAGRAAGGGAEPARVVLVLEGAARGGVPAGAHSGRVTVVHAAGSGDDAIVDEAAAAGHPVLVVTADRGLRARVSALGARVEGPSWLWDRLG